MSDNTFKDLVQRFKTNLLIAKIKDELEYRKAKKDYYIDGVITSRDLQPKGILDYFTDFSKGK